MYMLFQISSNSSAVTKRIYIVGHKHYLEKPRYHCKCFFFNKRFFSCIDCSHVIELKLIFSF